MDKTSKVFEVSGITALSPTDDEEDQPLARATQKKRYRATPLEQEDDQAFNSRQKKNKRPLNGHSPAKNRRQPSPLQEEDDLSDDNQASNSRQKKNKRGLIMLLLAPFGRSAAIMTL